MHNKPILIKRAINLGVSGYILKDSPSERLLHAVKEVQAGRKYLDPGLSDSLLTIICDHRTETDSDSLYNSRKTVENHRSKVLSKLKLDSPAELISLADKLCVI